MNNILPSIKQPFNILVGAGISKAPPSNGPLWSEIGNGFVDSIIRRILKESWRTFNSEEDFYEYRKTIKDYWFRPEQFWQIVRQWTTSEFIKTCFSSISLGQPNHIHKSIAKLMESGKINNVLTTNFDEYIEKCILSEKQLAIDKYDAKKYLRENVKTNLIIKPHGTISTDTSLIFTLSDTFSLNESMEKLIEKTLVNIPLVIAGYSGYDEDILPILKRLAKDIPEIIVICHPSGSANEPIRSLEGNVRIVTGDAGQIFSSFADVTIAKHNFNPIDPMTAYEKALDTLPIPMLPYLLSLLLDFTGDYSKAMTMAELAYDAADDSRYEISLTRFQKNYIKLNLLRLSDLIGDVVWKLIGLDREIELTNMYNLYSQQADRAYNLACRPYLTNKEIEEVEKICNMLTAPNAPKNNPAFRFEGFWIMGRLRKKQKSYDESIDYYSAGYLCIRGVVDKTNIKDIKHFKHNEIAAFLLDFGTALFDGAFDDRDDDMLKDAQNAYIVSKVWSSKTHDWVLYVKASVSLCKIYMLSGHVNSARAQLKDCEDYIDKTPDIGLKSRFQMLKQIVGE